jgi:uncharacterized protein (DUF362 family)
MPFPSEDNTLPTTQKKVGLVQGPNRRENLHAVLETISDEIDFSRTKKLLIKPNLVSRERSLANTHPDALRALLDFIYARFDGEVVIAEGAALCNTHESFARFGYRELSREYPVKLVDLNAGETVSLQVYNLFRRPAKVRLARAVVESDYRISIGPPKTHNTALVTLSIKNMVLGSLVNPAMSDILYLERIQPGQPIPQDHRRLLKMILPGKKRSDKLFMHQGYPIFNLNLAMLAKWVMPHLAVIDGFEAMEGNGPTWGDPVEWRVAIAGTDAVAVDHLVTYLMGFNPAQVGYLHYCTRLGLGEGNIEKIKIVGNTSLQAVQRQFKPHPAASRQVHWQLRNADRLLSLAKPG